MSIPLPPRRCYYDGCCEFTPGMHNGIYCREHNCKRRYENQKKRLTPLVTTREDSEKLWELQEARKYGKAVNAAEKNDYLWENKKWVSFDIETSNLKASIGTMLSASMKTVGGAGDIISYSIPGFKVGEPWQPRTDKELVEAVRDTLERYDYIITYYGTRFDIPFLQTRLLAHGMRPLTDYRHWDLYYVPKFRLALHSNRLAVVGEFLYGKTEKTRVIGEVWTRAMMGDQEAMDYIVEHCEKDVTELENIATDLRGFSNLSAIRLHHYGSSL